MNERSGEVTRRSNMAPGSHDYSSLQSVKKNSVLRYTLAAFVIVPALSLSRADGLIGSMAAKESAVVSDGTDRLTSTTTKLGFPWDQIDPFMNGLCGYFKCFFRHVNARDGFIVSHTTDSDEDQGLGWERGLALERHYGLKQPYYLGYPPQNVGVPGCVGNIQYEMSDSTSTAHLYAVDSRLFRGIVQGCHDKVCRHGWEKDILPPEDTPDSYSLEVTQVRYIHKPHLEYP